MKTIRFVTVATHSERYFPTLIESGRRNGIDIDVLGWGEKWQGFSWRYRLLADYLREKCEPSDIVIVMDGFDSVILAGKDEFVSKFLQMNTDIAFSIDQKVANPLAAYIRYRCFGSKPSEHMLNGGLYMGKAGPLLKFCNTMSARSQPKDDDQRLLNYWFRERNARDYVCGVDDGRNLFYNQWRGGGVKGNVDNGRFCAVIDSTQVRPCVVSGPGLTDMNTLVKQIGYKVNQVPSHFLHPKNLLIAWKKVSHYAQFFKSEITLFVVLTVLFVASRILNKKWSA